MLLWQLGVSNLGVRYVKFSVHKIRAVLMITNFLLYNTYETL